MTHSLNSKTRKITHHYIKIFFTILFLILVVVQSVFAETHQQLSTVRIGFIDNIPTPSIHNMPYRASLIDAAITMAQKDWEASSEQKRYNFEIVHYKYGDSTIEALDVVRQALNGDTVAAIGLTTSEYAAVAAPLLQGTSYTVISPYASAHSLMRYHPNLLLMDDPTTVEAKAITQFIEDELRPKKPLAIVAWDSIYSKDLYMALPKTLQQKFHLIKVLNDSKNLEKISLQVMQYKPDLIFLPLFGIFAGHLIKEMTSAGYQGIFVGGQSWGETNGKAFQTITQGVDFLGYEVRIPSRHFLSSEQKKFAERFEREFQVVFSPLAANIYDSLFFLFNRINRLKETPSREIVQKLIQQERSFTGTMGKVCLFDEWCDTRTYSVLKVDGKGFQPYQQIIVKGL